MDSETGVPVLKYKGRGFERWVLIYHVCVAAKLCLLKLLVPLYQS